MAFTRGMKRRASPLPRWGAKRRRTRGFKRRSSKYSSFSSQSGKIVSFGFRSKRMPRRQYKNVLWNASTVAEHHRSHQTNGFIHGTPAGGTVMSVVAYPLVRDNFWSTSGGGDSGAPAIDSKVFIRGGVSTVRVRNKGTSPVNVVVWVIRWTAAGTLAIPVNQDMSWDPSILSAQERNLRVLRTMRLTLEPSDLSTIVHRIRSRRIDQSDFNSSVNRDYWLVGINNFSGSTVDNDVVTSHNVSFTYDRYG